MCGFVGTLTPRGGDRLRHRGPSGAGYSGLALSWVNVSLEMARLAVVDQHAISVPFDFTKSCGVILAYNGEVYNHRELRAELSDGKPWETDCDAEVVARAWRRWGPGMLHRFNGMWGLCLVDTLKGEVFLARDRAGEKPLYYAPLGSGLAFASEIKALPIKLEEAPCLDADVFEFDCLETTPFMGVRRLGPGQYIHLKRLEDFSAPPQTWWRLPEVGDEMVSVGEVQDVLVDAVKTRIPSEVPYGIFVSGGLDSAIVQAIAKAERCYTVTLDDQAEALARLICDPTLISFGYEDLVEALPRVAYHLDTPATWTASAQWFMNRQAAKDGCVVVLSGEGADELFGGYTRYRLLWRMDQARKDPRLQGYDFVRGRVYGSDDEILARMIDRGNPKHALEVVRRFSGTGSLVDRAMRLDFATTMQCLLRMGDKMAAAYSLENRSPFLDYRLMELAARMPVRQKVTEIESKAILCEVARRVGVPKQIVDQPTKRGLYVPWAKWTGGEGWDRSSFAERMRVAWRGAFFSEQRSSER